jgi:hypothetical protein
VSRLTRSKNIKVCNRYVHLGHNRNRRGHATPLQLCSLGRYSGAGGCGHQHSPTRSTFVRVVHTERWRSCMQWRRAFVLPQTSGVGDVNNENLNQGAQPTVSHPIRPPAADALSPTLYRNADDPRSQAVAAVLLSTDHATQANTSGSLGVSATDWTSKFACYVHSYMASLPPLLDVTPR